MSKVKEPKRVCIKASPKENLTHKIDIATQTLERNIGFINSCDTKTSIVLTSIGVLLTIILTNDGLSAIFGIISSCGSGKTFCDILYLGGFLVSVGMLVIGMWKLVTVLIAKIEPSKKDSNPTTGPSMIFFGGILKVGNRAVYRNKFCPFLRVFKCKGSAVSSRHPLTQRKHSNPSRNRTHTLGTTCSWLTLSAGIHR